MFPRYFQVVITPELAGAVEDAYRVFARYRPLRGITVCPCDSCVSEEQRRLLMTPPVSAIDSEVLARYTDSAHEFDANVADDFRGLLPRYFELIAQDVFPTTGLESWTLARLRAARYRETWPAVEVAAVDRWFDALFCSVLVSPCICRERDGTLDIEGADIRLILRLAANAGRDIAGFLAIWDETMTREADLRLGFAAYETDLVRAAPATPGWDRWTAQADQALRVWLGRGEVRQRLEEACLREPEPAAATLLSYAEDVVATLIARTGTGGYRA